jgi:predicted Na+-dependent transporter
MIAWLLGAGFWVSALAMMATALWLPGDWSMVRPSITWWMSGILFFTALKVELRTVLEGLGDRACWLRLALAALAKLLVLPVVAYALTKIIAPDWALGVLIVLAMPAGMSAATMADLYGASVPFALLLTLLTAALCPLTIPLLVGLADAQTIEPAALVGRALYIMVLLVTPFIAAQLVRGGLRAMVLRHHRYWGRCSVGCACLLIFTGIAANRSAWTGLPYQTLLVPVGLCFIALCIAAIVARWSARIMPTDEAAAFGFCCLWLNTGLAVAFCDRFYHGDAQVILPSALVQLPTTALVTWFGRRTQPLAPLAALRGT